MGLSWLSLLLGIINSFKQRNYFLTCRQFSTKFSFFIVYFLSYLSPAPAACKSCQIGKDQVNAATLDESLQTSSVCQPFFPFIQSTSS